MDMFDHVEFGISAKDAAGLSLGTRKLIELSFLALLDSGIDSRSANVGCYASSVNHGFRALSDVVSLHNRTSISKPLTFSHV